MELKFWKWSIDEWIDIFIKETESESDCRDYMVFFSLKNIYKLHAPQEL